MNSVEFRSYEFFEDFLQILVYESFVVVIYGPPTLSRKIKYDISILLVHCVQRIHH